jgi:hypothetical protein
VRRHRHDGAVVVTLGTHSPTAIHMPYAIE